MTDRVWGKMQKIIKEAEKQKQTTVTVKVSLLKSAVKRANEITMAFDLTAMSLEER